MSRKRVGRGGSAAGAIAVLPGDERGSVFIFLTVFLLMMVFSLALVADLGSLHYCRARLQDAADAAALAAAGMAREGQPADAAEEACKYIERYGFTEPGEQWFDIDLAASTVTVTLESEAPMYFSRIFGTEAVGLASQARARWDSEGVRLSP